MSRKNEIDQLLEKSRDHLVKKKHEKRMDNIYSRVSVEDINTILNNIQVKILDNRPEGFKYWTDEYKELYLRSLLDVSELIDREIGINEKMVKEIMKKA